MTKLCVQCGTEFDLTPNHVGYANRCLNCNGEDVPRLMAKVSYPNKHVTDAIIEITANREEAIAFNRVQRRSSGASPLRSIITSKESFAGREAAKNGSGAERGAAYTTPLGERRRVKL